MSAEEIVLAQNIENADRACAACALGLLPLAVTGAALCLPRFGLAAPLLPAPVAAALLGLLALGLALPAALRRLGRGGRWLRGFLLLWLWVGGWLGGLLFPMAAPALDLLPLLFAARYPRRRLLLQITPAALLGVAAQVWVGGGFSGAWLALLWRAAPRLGTVAAAGLLPGLLRQDEQATLGGQAELLRQSELDALTGLYNRNKFFAMSRALYEHLECVGVLFVDLDDLKRINDTQGHQAGDQLLCRLARSLLHFSSRTCHCYRFGGDEFVVVLTHCSREQLQAFVVGWRKQMAQLNAQTPRQPCRASCGWAYGPGSQLSQLIEVADRRMYHNKNLQNSVTAG